MDIYNTVMHISLIGKGGEDNILHPTQPQN